AARDRALEEVDVSVAAHMFQGARRALHHLAVRESGTVAYFDQHIAWRERTERHTSANRELAAELHLVARVRLDGTDRHVVPLLAHSIPPALHVTRLGAGASRVARGVSGRRQVEALGVLRDHAVRVELRTDRLEAGLHARYPRARHTVRAALVEERDDLV